MVNYLYIKNKVLASIPNSKMFQPGCTKTSNTSQETKVVHGFRLAS
jgi:hypothetical protein